jgi:hypothetical protein
MKDSKNQSQNLEIYPLPEGVHPIWHADFILPYGTINLVHDKRSPREGHLADIGPFFAINHSVREAPTILVNNCQTLTELEEKVYKKIWEGNSLCFEIVLTRTPLDGPVPSQGLVEAIQAQVKATIKTHTPREYFNSVGKYFINPEKFS